MAHAIASYSVFKELINPDPVRAPVFVNSRNCWPLTPEKQKTRQQAPGTSANLLPLAELLEAYPLSIRYS